jgi:hypothetical protein
MKGYGGNKITWMNFGNMDQIELQNWNRWHWWHMWCVMNDVDDTNGPHDMDNVYAIYHRDIHKLMNMNFMNENHNIDKSWQHGWQKISHGSNSTTWIKLSYHGWK